MLVLQAGVLLPLITSRVLIGKGEDQGEVSVCVRLILQRASRFLSGHCCLCVYLMLLDVTKKLMNHYIHGAYKLLPHVTVSPRPSPSVFYTASKAIKELETGLGTRLLFVAVQTCYVCGQLHH